MNSIFLNKHHYFVGHYGQVWPQSYPCQCQQLKSYIFHNLIPRWLEAQMQGGRGVINGFPQGNITKISSKENPTKNSPKGKYYWTPTITFG